MAQTDIAYGWTPDATFNGASAGLTRAYPSWLNSYGYQGSLNTYQAPALPSAGEDPFMAQVAAAQAKTAAAPTTGDTTTQQQAAASPMAQGGGGELNAAGGQGTGELPSMANLSQFGRDFMGSMADITGSPGGMSADQGDITAEARGMYRGGIVTRNRLTGPNPKGPDDGYVPLNLGEGVLTAAALKHYGPGIVARLNKLAVPKDRLGGK